MDAETVLTTWRDRTGAYSPAYYAYYGSDDASEAVLAALEPVVDEDAAILELGCGVGRHLSHLLDAGYRDLHGIDVNRTAADVMADAYPALWEAGSFRFESIESVVTDFEDGRFDAVFSVQTLQHIHPDHEWVFAEIARITDRLLLTVELESDEVGATSPTLVDDALPLYRRDWHSVFTALGFEQTDRTTLRRGTLRVFRPTAAE